MTAEGRPATVETTAAPDELAHRPSPVAGISWNVWWLGVTSFCTDISSEMLYPLVPIFVTATLGGPASIVGLIEGVAEATASFVRLFPAGSPIGSGGAARS